MSGPWLTPTFFLGSFSRSALLLEVQNLPGDSSDYPRASGKARKIRGRLASPSCPDKSHRDRVLPIHPQLRRLLQNKPQHGDGRLFHGPKGGKLKPDTVRLVLIREVIEPLAEQFPTPEGEICSTCANRGVPEQVVMAWLGHADSRMVRHYYHLHDEASQRMMERLNFLGEAGGAGAAGKVS